jgi:hypothetical protein
MELTMRTPAMSHPKLGTAAAIIAAAMLALPAIALAQKPTTRRQAPIEIRGQVPTPQVVTVRPRAVPAYSRQILVPRFFNHDFWPEIEQGYQFIPQRQLTGDSHLDSLGTHADWHLADSASTTGIGHLADSSSASGVRMPSTPASDSSAVTKAPRPPTGTASARHPHAQHP